jgi:hypothetical protein
LNLLKINIGLRIGSREPWVEPQVRNTSRANVATRSL